MMGWIRRAKSRRGAVGLMTGVALVPLIGAAGAGMDMARLGYAKAALQEAVDAATMAGAAAYQSSSAGTQATQTATNYFNAYVTPMAGLLTQTTFSATASTGNNSQGYASNTVSSTASATLSASLMSIVGVRTLSVTASATAANPISTPVVTVGSVGSSAGDWNSVYMYALPYSASSGYDYTYAPTLSGMYEVGSNCNNQSVNWSSSSTCNGKTGAVAPSGQTFAATTTTRVGFMLINVTNGLASGNKSNNGFGAAPGALQFFYTSPMSQGSNPSAYTSQSDYAWKLLTNQELNEPSVTYPTTSNSNLPNCSLIIQLVDPNNLPTQPPYSGMCFSATDPRSGYQYANLTCGEMAGRTFMYWWNDMGGSSDDMDYNDFYYTLTCRPGNSTPNGGSTSNNTTSNYNLNVSMVQ